MLRRVCALVLAAALLLLPCSCRQSPSEESAEASSAEPAAMRAVATLYPEWSAEETYAEGDIVVFENQYFRALCKTCGATPQTEEGQKAWHYLGDVPLTDSLYYTDVSSSSWYAEAINALAAQDLLSGIGSGGNFQPSRPITRGQFAGVLCRALEIAPAEEGENFSDAGDEWYTPYLAALLQQGLAESDEDGRFYPKHYITRQEACQLIYAACDGFAEDPDTVLAPYSDAEDVASWAIQAVSWCLERGILEGSDGEVLPEATLSRAEAAQMVYALLQWREK